MAFVKGALALVLCVWQPSARAARVLKPQDVTTAVLNNSFQAERIALDMQTSYVSLERALGRYDFGLDGKVAYEYREAETLSGLSNPIDKTLTASLALRKSSRIGATFEVGYLHQAQSSVLNVLTATTREPTLALDAGYLQWRQNLWANSFGVSDRAELSVARAAFGAADLNKQEATENLVLESLVLFWRAYVTQTQLKDAIAARKMYQDLIGAVQRRGRYGLEKGGEYAQVMADYAASDSAVKAASYAYLRELKALEKLMQEPFNEDVEFQVEEVVPDLPRLSPVNKSKLRRVILGRTAVQNAQDLERAAQWRNRPAIDLVARATSTGVDSRAAAAYSELISGTKPTYYVGFELNMPLDSSVQRANQAEARVQLQRERLNLKSAEQDTDINLELLERQLEQTHLGALGALEVEKYRQRTVREQENEYRQGRLPLRDLLQTFRLFFESQTYRVQAIGAYHVALNQVAAERDELVK